MKMLLASMLLAGVLGRAEVPNPADYAVSVHVQSSSLVYECAGFGTNVSCGPMQHLSALIDGKTYELEGNPPHLDVLRLGDYKAKLLKKDESRAYEYQWIYEFLFPDGKTRQYLVMAEPQ